MHCLGVINRVMLGSISLTHLCAKGITSSAELSKVIYTLTMYVNVTVSACSTESSIEITCIDIAQAGLSLFGHYWMY